MGLQKVHLREADKLRKQTDGLSTQQHRAGALSMDLLVALQILPGFFSNCLFLALYDSVVLLRRVMSLLSFSGSAACGEWRRMLTSAGLRSIWNSFLLDAYKQVKLGGEAPNSKVVKVPSIIGTRQSPGSKASNECHLLDFETSDRPLVLPAFKQLVEDFSDVADFLLVYVQEAHPLDGWAAPAVGPGCFRVRQHRTLEERMLAARSLLEHFALPPQCQLVIDSMDNDANAAYGVSYERGYGQSYTWSRGMDRATPGAGVWTEVHLEQGNGQSYTWSRGMEGGRAGEGVQIEEAPQKGCGWRQSQS
ncbi:hypothetical protein JZ751_004830 [Albula glossodonta]|uniref:Iodothyronine deiodinase n=1 Tax=Albula glossodonta TaxID=121402 RepID=A0A8T2P1J1_9TELE|nr:hypothetical protein JZ751_004830 [Albula glossodonta]